MAVISAPLNASNSLARAWWRDLDWSLLLLVLLLSVWSLSTIASATHSRDEISFSGRPSVITGAPDEPSATTTPLAARSRGGWSDVAKQGVWVALGLTIMIVLAFKDYPFWMHLQAWLYLGALLLLLLLLFLPSSIAPTINGAKSWIRLGGFALQPSEFAKFAIIVSLAAYVCRRQEQVREWKVVLGSLAFLLPALALVLKQPDFGTALAILAIWFGTLFFGGARLRHLGLVALVGIIAFGSLWHFDKLKPHQKARLAVFLNTNPTTREDRRDGYQLKQSQIAIGSGQLAGQGWGQGMQIAPVMCRKTPPISSSPSSPKNSVSSARLRCSACIFYYCCAPVRLRSAPTIISAL